jgi:hypothetical protein
VIQCRDKNRCSEEKLKANSESRVSLEPLLPPTRASRALSKASHAVDQLIQEVKLAA